MEGASSNGPPANVKEIFVKPEKPAQDANGLEDKDKVIAALRDKISDLEAALQRQQQQIETLSKQLPAGSEQQQREKELEEENKNPLPRYWTQEEHKRYLEAVERYGIKDVRAIAEYVGTRTVVQVRTHSQKYQLQLEREKRKSPGLQGLSDVGQKRQRKTVQEGEGVLQLSNNEPPSSAGDLAAIVREPDIRKRAQSIAERYYWNRFTQAEVEFALRTLDDANALSSLSPQEVLVCLNNFLNMLDPSRLRRHSVATPYLANRYSTPASTIDPNKALPLYDPLDPIGINHLQLYNAMMTFHPAVHSSQLAALQYQAQLSQLQQHLHGSITPYSASEHEAESVLPPHLTAVSLSANDHSLLLPPDTLPIPALPDGFDLPDTAFAVPKPPPPAPPPPPVSSQSPPTS